MKRAHLGTTIRSIGLGGVAALAISPLALVTPAQAGTPVAAAASSASVQSGRPDPAYTPTERRAAIIQAKQERAATADRLRLGAKDGLVVKDVMRDVDGTRHVRYNRTFDGSRSSAAT